MACLFLMCLTAVCALDVASSLRIGKVERTTSEADSNKFTVSVHYDQAEQKPLSECLVHNYSQSLSGIALQGVVTYNSQDKSGVARVEVDKTVDDAEVFFGLSRNHYISSRLNLRGDATLTHDVNFAFSTITPGTDVAYKASDGPQQYSQCQEMNLTCCPPKFHYTHTFVTPIGRTMTVTVVNPHPSSDSQLTRGNKELHLFGNLLDKATRQIKTTETKTNWTEDAQGTVTNTFTLATDVNVINGFYTGIFYYTLAKSDSPLDHAIKEQIVLLVHEDSNQGPFPDDFLKVNVDEKSKKCIHQRYCNMNCWAYGNDIQSLQIYQVTAEGGEVAMEAELYHELDGYSWSAYVNLEGSPSGQYVCRVKQGDLEVSETVQLLLLETEALADSLTYEMMDNEKVKVTCKGSGSQPLEVTLNWGEYNKVNEVLAPGVKGVVSYTPGQAQGDGPGNAVATAILDTVSVSRATIVCKASNPASDGYEYLKTESFLEKA